MGHAVPQDLNTMLLVHAPWVGVATSTVVVTSTIIQIVLVIHVCICTLHAYDTTYKVPYHLLLELN